MHMYACVGPHPFQKKRKQTEEEREEEQIALTCAGYLQEDGFQKAENS